MNNDEIPSIEKNPIFQQLDALRKKYDEKPHRVFSSVKLVHKFTYESGKVETLDYKKLNLTREQFSQYWNELFAWIEQYKDNKDLGDNWREFIQWVLPKNEEE